MIINVTQVKHSVEFPYFNRKCSPLKCGVAVTPYVNQLGYYKQYILSDFTRTKRFKVDLRLTTESILLKAYHGHSLAIAGKHKHKSLFI